MARLTRAVQKIFGSTAGASDIAQIGSLRNGEIVYTTDPVTLQGLALYLTGLKGIVSSDKYIPALEDINGIYFLFSRQLAYLMQEGIAEWDASTEYHENSIVKDPGTIDQYYSIADDNTGNELTDDTKWLPVGSGPGIPLGGYVAVAIGMTGADSDATMIAKGFAKCNGTTPATQGVVSPAITATMPNINDGAFIRGNATAWTTGAKSGGADTVTLSSTELPSHTHTINQSSAGYKAPDLAHTHTVSSSGAHVHEVSGNRNVMYMAQNFNGGTVYVMQEGTQFGGSANAASAPDATGAHTHTTASGSGTVETASNHTHSVSANTTGSGSAFSILPSYFSAVYYMRVR